MEGMFDLALTHVLQSEGGKVDNPHDPGGRTNAGVTQRVYDDFRRRNGDEPRDVFDMDPSERNGIYRRYWDAIGGDKLPAGLDYEAFDTAVNMGRKKGEPIGTLAKEFLAGVDQTKPVTDQIEQYRAQRQKFYEGIKGPSGFQTFGEGWTNRNVEVANQAKEAWFQNEVPYSPPQAKPAQVAAPADVPAAARHAKGASLHEAVRTALAQGPGTYTTTHRRKHRA
jgi:lysozyme family protein